MNVYSRFKIGGDRLEDSWGRPVSILRCGGTEWSGVGWLGVTKSDQITSEGVRVVVKNIDVFLRSSGGYLPKKEDVIRFDDDGTRYITTPIAGELWRWSDATRETLRVHVQELKE